MSPFLLLSSIILPFLLALLVAILWIQLRVKSGEIERLATERNELRPLLEESVRLRALLAEKEHQIEALTRELAEIRQENLRLNRENAGLKEELRADEEKLRWLELAEQKLRDAFSALAGEVLKGNAEEFLKQSRAELTVFLQSLQGNLTTHKVELKGVVEPLEKILKQLDEEVRLLEQRREGAYQGILKEIENLEKVTRELQNSTAHLNRVLSSPTARGHWGEMELRRIVELAGMQNHVDFDIQVEFRGEDGSKSRVDMVIYLLNEGKIPVDAKVPMDDYFRASQATTEEERRRHLKAHAQALIKHINDLSRRAYHEKLGSSPGFTVLFLPSEACLISAYDGEPELFEYSIRARVLLSTPLTLFALLRSIAEGWRQFEWTQDAQRFFEEGKKLCERLSRFSRYIQDLGNALNQTLTKYNELVGSWDGRLYPSLKRFYELGRISEEPPTLREIPLTPRPLRPPAELSEEEDEG
jgi:DNA recombination protein RmuC